MLTLDSNCLIQLLDSDTFDSCFNGGVMLRQLTDLNFKMVPSLLAVREMSPLKFQKLCCINLQRRILDFIRHPRWNFCWNS